MVLPTEVPSAPSQQQMCEETSDAFVEPAAETHEEQPPLPDARGHCGVAPALLGITGGLLLVAAAVLCIVGDGDGQHGLRGGISSGSAVGGQHGKAPLRILAAGGGSAIAGAWMACGGFFGSCWATIGHLTAGVCHACSGAVASIWTGIFKCSAELCHSCGGAIHKLPWCGNCLGSCWFSWGNLFGGCCHAGGRFLANLWLTTVNCLGSLFTILGGLGSDCCGTCGEFLNRMCPI